jgi:hypothetical protein
MMPCLRAAAEAAALQRPLPDNALRVVAHCTNREDRAVADVSGQTFFLETIARTKRQSILWR